MIKLGSRTNLELIDKRLADIPETELLTLAGIAARNGQYPPEYLWLKELGYLHRSERLINEHNRRAEVRNLTRRITESPDVIREIREAADRQVAMAERELRANQTRLAKL